MDTPLVIGAGTGVAKRIGFVKVPEMVYGAFRSSGRPVYFATMPHLGLGPMEETYGELAELFEREFGDQPVDEIDHSQFVIHGLRRSAEYPGRVRKLWGLNGPIWGTRLADLGKLAPMALRGCLPQVVADFQTDSLYLQKIRGLVETASQQRGLRTETNLVSSPHDGFVLPSRHANFVVKGDTSISNYCFSGSRPRHLPEEIAWIQALRPLPRLSHLWELFDPGLIGAIISNLRDDDIPAAA